MNQARLCHGQTSRGNGGYTINNRFAVQYTKGVAHDFNTLDPGVIAWVDRDHQYMDVPASWAICCWLVQTRNPYHSRGKYLKKIGLGKFFGST